MLQGGINSCLLKISVVSNRPASPGEKEEKKPHLKFNCTAIDSSCAEDRTAGIL